MPNTSVTTLSGTSRSASCPHQPPCPASNTPDHDAARVVASHPEQGWALLCNGVVVFEDTGELLPDGTALAPRRPASHHETVLGGEH